MNFRGWKLIRICFILFICCRACFIYGFTNKNIQGFNYGIWNDLYSEDRWLSREEIVIGGYLSDVNTLQGVRAKSTNQTAVEGIILKPDDVDNSQLSFFQANQIPFFVIGNTNTGRQIQYAHLGINLFVTRDDRDNLPDSLNNADVLTSDLFPRAMRDDDSIPVTLNAVIKNYNHWTGIVVYNGKDNQTCAIYVDPFGSDMSSDQRQYLKDNNITQIDVLKIRQQYDGHNCGVYTIKNLKDISEFLRRKYNKEGAKGTNDRREITLTKLDIKKLENLISRNSKKGADLRRALYGRGEVEPIDYDQFFTKKFERELESALPREYHRMMHDIISHNNHITRSLYKESLLLLHKKHKIQKDRAFDGDNENYHDFYKDNRNLKNLDKKQITKQKSTLAIFSIKPYMTISNNPYRGVIGSLSINTEKTQLGFFYDICELKERHMIGNNFGGFVSYDLYEFGSLYLKYSHETYKPSEKNTAIDKDVRVHTNNLDVAYAMHFNFQDVFIDISPMVSYSNIYIKDPLFSAVFFDDQNANLRVHLISPKLLINFDYKYSVSQDLDIDINFAVEGGYKFFIASKLADNQYLDGLFSAAKSMKNNSIFLLSGNVGSNFKNFVFEIGYGYEFVKKEQIISALIKIDF